ncbi:MAG: cytochrome c [Xanthobacteraceae bacterium]|nr:cytochrome c [Xanthobacteraceae bacterium]
MLSRLIEPARSALPLASVAIAGMVLMLSAPSVQADEQTRSRPLTSLSTGFRFTEQTGAELFASVCQGCHMPDGGGATGAGTYPSLQKDSNLETSGYPVYVVVLGQKAMPPVGAMMSDEQVAAVVNYLRTHFGNQYQDAVTAEDVKRVRP